MRSVSWIDPGHVLAQIFRISSTGGAQPSHLLCSVVRPLVIHAPFNIPSDTLRCMFYPNIIDLSLWWSKNGPFGVDIAIAIGIEISAMIVFVDFDSDPDSDSDGYSQYENFLS